MDHGLRKKTIKVTINKKIFSSNKCVTIIELEILMLLLLTRICVLMLITDR